MKVYQCHTRFLATALDTYISVGASLYMYENSTKLVIRGNSTSGTENPEVEQLDNEYTELNDVSWFSQNIIDTFFTFVKTIVEDEAGGAPENESTVNSFNDNISGLLANVNILMANQAIMGFQLTVANTASVLNFGDTIQNDFKDALQIDAGNSQNDIHSVPNGNILANIGGLVAQNIGTPVGNFAVNAPGDSIAFNGDKDMSSASCARTGLAIWTFNGWLGKDWGAGNEKTISSVQTWGANNVGYAGQDNVDHTLKLFGSTDISGASQKAPAGTIVELATLTFAGTDNTVNTKILNSLDNSTAYRYIWVRNSVAAGNAAHYFSEIEFTELIATPVIIQSIVQSFINVPSFVSLTLFITETDVVTENVDIVGEVSRDGGVTFTTISLSVLGIPVPGVGKLLFGLVDVTGQPSGKDMVWKITASNQKAFVVEGVAIQGK